MEGRKIRYIRKRKGVFIHGKEVHKERRYTWKDFAHREEVYTKRNYTIQRGGSGGTDKREGGKVLIEGRKRRYTRRRGIDG